MADRPAFIYLFPPSCIHPCPGEHSRMPWPMDLHLFIYFQTDAFIHVQVSIPECHGQRTSIFCFFSDRCIHPCLGEHSQMPWPTDLHLYIYFHPAASTHVLVSIPECHGQWTCIF